MCPCAKFVPLVSLPTQAKLYAKAAGRGHSILTFPQGLGFATFVLVVTLTNIHPCLSRVGHSLQQMIFAQLCIIRARRVVRGSILHLAATLQRTTTRVNVLGVRKVFLATFRTQLLMYQMLLTSRIESNVRRMGYGTLAVILIVGAFVLARQTQVLELVLVTQLRS